MSDTVSTCLLDLMDTPGPDSGGVAQLRIAEGTDPRSDARLTSFRGLEKLIQEGVSSNNESLVRDVVARANDVSKNSEQVRTQVLRMLWKAVLDAPP